MMMHVRLVLPVLALLCCAAGSGVEAAESYDNCTGYITALPTTISKPGTWCLRQDLATSIVSGAAIGVAANNVTIDCNDFKVGGMNAGIYTDAIGIYNMNQRLNVTVRHCNVRGFAEGIDLDGDGQIVEDNALDGNTELGIRTYGGGNIVRDNVVRDTGGRPGFGSAVGIALLGHGNLASGNKVTGVAADADLNSSGVSMGIQIAGAASENMVTGLIPPGTIGNAIGIQLGTSFGVARGNTVQQSFATRGTGIAGNGPERAVCRDNIVQDYDIGIADCQSDGDIVQAAIH